MIWSTVSLQVQKADSGSEFSTDGSSLNFLYFNLEQACTKNHLCCHTWQK